MWNSSVCHSAASVSQKLFCRSSWPLLSKNRPVSSAGETNRSKGNSPPPGSPSSPNHPLQCPRLDGHPILISSGPQIWFVLRLVALKAHPSALYFRSIKEVIPPHQQLNNWEARDAGQPGYFSKNTSKRGQFDDTWNWLIKFPRTKSIQFYHSFIDCNEIEHPVFFCLEDVHNLLG